MAKGRRPRHGSLAFYPRKRTKRIYPSVSSFVDAKKTCIQGFVAYKAGMTHVMITDNYQNSPSYGQRVSVPVTVLECPAIFVFGIRAYQKTYAGLKAVSDVYAEKFSKDLSRVLVLPKKHNKEEKENRIKKIEGMLDKIEEFRALVHTQPRKAKLKKKPELIELKIGGKDKKEIWKYALDILGKEIRIKDLFEEGEWIDTIGVTKGKGTSGPVKRFGIAIQRRKAKKHRRHPGSIGAWTPSRVLWTVPMAGQHGYQRRTELNKRVLKLGEKGEEVTPEGGFVNYGEVDTDYALISGSVPGPKKRLIVIRHALREKEIKERPLPSIVRISRSSQN